VGANAAVVEMLQHLHDNNVDLTQYVARVKEKDSKIRLMGFGHRLYKNWDPRAKIIKQMTDKVLGNLKGLIRFWRSQALEDVALSDPTSSSATCTRTWISTPASSCGRSGYR